MKKVIKYIVIILLLIVLDQGAKLLVDIFFIADVDLMQVSNTIHIHPMVNDSTILEITQKANDSQLSFSFLMFFYIAKDVISFFFICLALNVVSRFCSETKLKMNPKIINIVICLSIAAVLCNWIDQVFWRGTHDFICVSWEGTEWSVDHYYPIINHHSMDFKDIYIYITIVLVPLFFIIVAIKTFILNKEERKELEKELIQRLKNFFNKVFSHRNVEEKDTLESKKNEILIE